MPRFYVTMCDPSNAEIKGYVTRADNEVDAICNHPWLSQVYRSEWIAANIDGVTEEETTQNIYKLLSWITLCENLDELTMSALNAGDGSASRLTVVE